MIWVTFWIILGTLWAWQALLEYSSVNKRFMSVGWQIFNVCLNILFLPFGFCLGTFIFFIGRKVVEGDREFTDFDFTAIKMITRYKKTSEEVTSDKKD